MKKILVTDDHNLFRKSFVALLQRINPDKSFEYIEAENGLEALYLIEENQIDVVFLDQSMPYLSGYETCHRIFELSKKPSIIFLTRFDEGIAVSRLLRLGVSFLSKDAALKEILLALQFACQGLQYIQQGFEIYLERSHDISLTQPEHQIIELLHAGSSLDEISKKLNTNHKTVRDHIHTVLTKNNFKNVAELISVTLRNGLIK